MSLSYTNTACEENHPVYGLRARKKRLFLEKHVVAVPPVNCEFLPGDIVTFTNDSGIVFEGITILGFVHEIDPDFRPEAIIYLDWESYWFSIDATPLTFEQRKSGQALSLEQLHGLWRHLGDVPVGDDDCIQTSWRQFPAGTDRQEIWLWFDGQHSIAALMGLAD